MTVYNRMKPDPSERLLPIDPRIHRKCETALSKAIAAFPELLAQTHPDHAVDVVADLIKVMLCRPQSGKKAESLQDAIQRICGTENDEDRGRQEQGNSRLGERGY